MIKVSIVVPVYNVEPYICDCLNSLINQTLKEIEIIVIDDGSTDKSGKLADDFAKIDQRITVIHQKNAGYSAAVNLGIKKARGEFIGIVESDDLVDETMYEKLYRAATKQKADVAKAMFYKYNSLAKKEKDRKVVFKNPGGVDLENAPDTPFMAKDWPAIIAFHASIWSAIYNAKLIKKNPIPNTPGASYQDLPFMLKIMSTAKNIVVVKEPLYYWRNEPAQTHSTNAHGKKAFYMIENTVLGKKILEENGTFDALKTGFYAQAFYTNIAFFHQIDRSYKQEYLLKFKNLLKDEEFNKPPEFYYLRPEDLKAIKVIKSGKSWRELERVYTLGRAKRLLKKLFRF